MKVKVKLTDFNDACIKDVIYNGYVEVEAEPIEEKTPDWIGRFNLIARMLTMVNPQEVISFIKQLLKEFAEDFLKLARDPTTDLYSDMDVIFKKYGIED